MASLQKWKLPKELLGSAGIGILTQTNTNERLAGAGYFEIQNYCESLHMRLNCRVPMVRTEV